MVSPYPFKGGNVSEYETFVGEAGTYNTRHIPSGETIPCVQPSDKATHSVLSGLDMLPIANLAVGVLNLGVGVYNAFKLHQVEKKLSQNQAQTQAYFQNIRSTLNAHQRTLEVLVCHQYNLSQQMKILREEMRSGFQQVVQEIQDTEARRRKKEFYANTHELLEVYERFVDHLPDLSEADRLIDRAEKLEAWLQAELNQIEVGKPERLPLMVALSFSIRAKADAFEAKGGNYIASADKSLTKLRKQLCQEAYALCNGSNLYTLGVEMPEMVYQYALLNRSLGKGIELRQKTLSELWFSPEEVTWNDGLEEFRLIFEKALADLPQDVRFNKNTGITLNTLADYDWYIRFAGKDRQSFDVHSIKAINLSVILKTIGHPNPDEGIILKEDLRTLMLFSLPEASDSFAQRIQQEFDWEERPQILSNGTLKKSESKSRYNPGMADS